MFLTWSKSCIFCTGKETATSAGPVGIGFMRFITMKAEIDLLHKENFVHNFS
jgi:hypothetical protein